MQSSRKKSVNSKKDAARARLKRQSYRRHHHHHQPFIRFIDCWRIFCCRCCNKNVFRTSLCPAGRSHRPFPHPLTSKEARPSRSWTAPCPSERSSPNAGRPAGHRQTEECNPSRDIQRQSKLACYIILPDKTAHSMTQLANNGSTNSTSRELASSSSAPSTSLLRKSTLSASPTTPLPPSSPSSPSNQPPKRRAPFWPPGPWCTPASLWPTSTWTPSSSVSRPLQERQMVSDRWWEACYSQCHWAWPAF